MIADRAPDSLDIQIEVGRGIAAHIAEDPNLIVDVDELPVLARRLTRSPFEDESSDIRASRSKAHRFDLAATAEAEAVERVGQLHQQAGRAADVSKSKVADHLKRIGHRYLDLRVA